MKILIIGGTGFVSGTLARVALECGHDVTLVTRGLKPLPAGARHIRADRKEAGSLASAVTETYDFAIDCIGYMQEDAAQDVACILPKCGHFGFISTDFVYDPAFRQYPQPETNMHFLEDDSYGANKRRCELVLLDAAAKGLGHWTVFRPCHIYGPGSLLGCLPRHGRDKLLLDRIRRGEPLELVAAGTLLQQPIFAEDLARLILSSAGCRDSWGQFYNCAGPEIAESAEYYRIIARHIGCGLEIKELPIAEYRALHPEDKSFLVHRIYDLAKIRRDHLAAPSTGLAEGLRRHVESCLALERKA